MNPEKTKSAARELLKFIPIEFQKEFLEQLAQFTETAIRESDEIVSLLQIQ